MRRIGLAFCSGVAAVAVLAGCSSDPGVTPPGGSGITGGGGQQGKAGMSPFGSMQMLADTVSGKQAAAKTASFHISGSMGGQQLQGDGVVDISKPGSPATQTTLHIQGHDVSLVVKDKILYLKSPTPMAGKPWIKIDTSGKDPMSAMFGQALTQSSDSSDPTKLLQQLKDSGKITASRQETLNGKQTVHYTIALDVKKLVRQQIDKMRASAGNKLPGNIDQQLDQATAKMPATVPAEVWIDDQQLPAQYTVTVPSLGGAAGANQQSTVTTTYQDWGKPVTVNVPPADQVADIAQLRQQLGGGAVPGAPGAVPGARPGG